MTSTDGDRLTVLLGGPLRNEVGEGSGEIQVGMPDPPTVEGLLRGLGLAPESAKLMMVNGRGATAETPLRSGDRVAIFPPELSFNTFVSLCFRKERVAARSRKLTSKGGGQGAQD